MSRKQSQPGQTPEMPEPPTPPDREWPKLNSKHLATLNAVFENPKRGDIPWRDIGGLFLALGGWVENRAGSRRGVVPRERIAIFHEPHPEKVTDKGALVSVRRFLLSAGVEPW